MKYGNYEWPNVYEEAEEMIITAMLIYHFAKLRDLAKRSIIRTPEKILHLPITAIDAVETVEEHVEEIAREIGIERLEMLKSALALVHERCVENDMQTSADMTIVALSDDSAHYELVYSMGLTIVAFGDDHADKELVYAVGVDCGRKRIVVAFRGTITRRDFLIDATFQMTSQLNPLADTRHQDPLINLHKGFCDYLFSRAYNVGKGTSKFDEIMNYVLPLIEKHSDFRLYVTGHSLGGALATIFSFKVAASNLPIQKPITCVSVASPKVGGNCFRKAFQSLEEQGKLRHLRVANSEDPVPMFYPPVSCGLLCGALGPSKLVNFSAGDKVSKLHKEIYYHVGVKLKLLGHENKSTPASFSVTYARGPMDEGSLLSAASCTQHFRKSYRLNHHLPKEYIHRLSMLKHQLECVYLNDLYAQMCDNLLENHEVGTKDTEKITCEEDTDFMFQKEQQEYDAEESTIKCWNEDEDGAPHYTSSGSSLGFSRRNSLLEEETEEEMCVEKTTQLLQKLVRVDSVRSYGSSGFSRLHSLLEEFQDDTTEEDSNEETFDVALSSKPGASVEKTSFSKTSSSLEERDAAIAESEVTREASSPWELDEDAELVIRDNVNDQQSNGLLEEQESLSSSDTFFPLQQAMDSNIYVSTITHVQFEDPLPMISNEQADKTNFLLHREGQIEESTPLSVSSCTAGAECRDEAEEDTHVADALEKNTLRSAAADIANHTIPIQHYAIQSEKVNFGINETIPSRQWCKMFPYALEEKVCFCI